MGKFKRLLKRKHSLKKAHEYIEDSEDDGAHRSTKQNGNENGHAVNGSHSLSSSERGSFSEIRTSDVFGTSSQSYKSKIHPPTRGPAGISETQRQGARATGNLASGMVTGSGSQILWYFISSLGATSEKSLSRNWLPGGSTISHGKEWVYEVRQGHGESEMRTLRNQMNGRLYRTGNRVQGGGWSRLLLGDEFTATPSRKQSHKLKFVVSYCACLKCRIAGMRTEQEFNDMDKMLEDAELGIGFEEKEESVNGKESATVAPVLKRRGECNAKTSPNAMPITNDTIQKLMQYIDLPLLGNDLGLLGETLHSQEFELGTVSKISARSAKVSFSKYAKKFLRNDRYVGPLSAAEIGTIVAEKAKEHFRQQKGKTVRRFYVCGVLHKIFLEGVSVVLAKPTTEKKDDEKRKEKIGVLFRRQMMSVFVGTLALEESFGSFIHTEASMYVGFGHDNHGAQSIYAKGKLGEARPLGINELRSHFKVQDGQDMVLEMY